MITDYPVEWTAPQVRETLQVLSAIYLPADIERIVQDAGLSTAEVAWDRRPALTWRSVLELAAANVAVDKLLDTVVEQRPALRVRLTELRSPEPMVPDDPATADPAAHDYESSKWRNFSADGQAEAVIIAGQPTFVDISFLAVGLARARGVCRLATRFPDAGSGTAFRVGTRHLLTNHHVLFNQRDGGRKVVSAQAWFNYETDESGRLRPLRQVECDPDSIVGEADEDWALIATSEPIPDEFPILPLTNTRAPEIDDRVYIIQHPYGGQKKIAFQHNLVRSVDQWKIQYWTDTDLGSSGSPVFDENWSVVALHHFSLTAPKSDRIGVRNQGRRIDHVVARMRQLGVWPVVDR
jgi:V8-like Glu-specific endopeptidase